MDSPWSVVFFPSPGEKHSPFDLINKIKVDADRANIAHRLTFISQRDRGDWPHTWIHKLSNNVSQLTAGSFRVMYALDGRNIVVVHCCRKVSQKTKARDLNRAELNYKDYISSKG